MAYLLDTNICIYLTKNQPARVKEKFLSIDKKLIFISSITVAELEYGVEKSAYLKKNEEALREFLSEITIINFDAPAAAHYGNIRASLEKQGTPIGSNDLLIAAIAKCADLTLITNNEREFGRVAGLKIENWVK